MTREEAKNWLNKLYARTDITNEYGDLEDMQPYKEAIDMANKALEQDSVLDKIKAEISCNIVEDDASGHTPARLRADWAAANQAHMIDIAIIDKYNVESKDKCKNCEYYYNPDYTRCHKCKAESEEI